MKHAGFTVHVIYYSDWLNKFDTVIGISVYLLHTGATCNNMQVYSRYLGSFCTILPDRVL